MSFLAELRARLERARAHVEALERVIELEHEGQAAQMPKDAEAQRIPARARVPRQAAQARSSAQPVETGKGTPPSAPRPSATRRHHPGPDEIPTGKKWCGACERILPRAEFGVNNQKPDGLHNHCKVCKNAGQRRAREAQAKKEGRKLRRSPKKAKAEEAEPVRALEAEDLELDNETEPRRTILHRAGQGGELAKQEHAARMERIARRVAARKNRRHGRKQDGAGNGPFTRCLFQRAPQTVGDTVLTLHSVTCGAVVIAGDEADHLSDVHDLDLTAAAEQTAKYFAAIPQAAEGGGRTTTTISGSGQGSRGSA